MELNLWALALLMSKLGIYLGFAVAVGGVSLVFILAGNARRLGRPLGQYLWILTVLALLCTSLAFFVQVGAVADSGWSGMWHPLFRSILWSSTVGDSTLWRAIGFALMLVVLAAFRIPRDIKGGACFRILAFVLWVVALAMLAFSSSLVGHSAELGLWVQLALSVHVLAIAWWMGALWPLWLSCKKLDGELLHALMPRFGQFAQAAVALLILVGVFLAIQLLDSVSALWLTEYGRTLSIKLIGVSIILLLALYHKLRLVPALLSNPESSSRLARSIQIEMALGFLIFLATAVLTTLVGPVHAA